MLAIGAVSQRGRGPPFAIAASRESAVPTAHRQEILRKIRHYQALIEIVGTSQEARDDLQRAIGVLEAELASLDAAVSESPRSDE